MNSDDRLLMPAEAARILGVDPKTVTRYVRAGKLRATYTLGGHRRFAMSDIRQAQKEASKRGR